MAQNIGLGAKIKKFLKRDNEETRRNQDEHTEIVLKNQICVASSDDRYKDLVHREIKKLDLNNVEKIYSKKLNQAEVKERLVKIKKGKNCLPYYDGSKMIIMVATSSHTLMLISEKHESQLGPAYKLAKEEGAKVFVVLVAHEKSDSLKSQDLYATNMESDLEGQAEMLRLIEQKQFISMGFLYDPENLKFNKAQKDALQKWTLESCLPGDDVQLNAGAQNKEEALQNEKVPGGRKIKLISPGESSRNTEQEEKLQDKLCIAGTSDTYLKLVKSQIEIISNGCLKPSSRKLNIEELKVRNKERKEFQKGKQSFLQKKEPKEPELYFEGAKLVMLVATGSPRLILISRTEESQLGPAYRLAKDEGAEIFVVLTAHDGSENLPEELPYSGCLENAFKQQPELYRLKEADRFISVGYIYDPSSLKFNNKQIKFIKDWISKIPIFS